MTQMGLDYLKHEENKRHNLATESIDSRNATSNERNASSNERNATSNESNAISNRISADAKSYEASFADDKVRIMQQEANAKDKANQIAADRNVIAQQEADAKDEANRIADEKVRVEADKVLKEYEVKLEANKNAAAANKIQEARNIMDHLSASDAAAFAAKLNGADLRWQTVARANTLFDQILGMFRIKVGK